MNTKFGQGWHRLKGGAARAVGLPSRIDLLGAAEFLRRGVADLVFPPSCVSCEAELDVEATPASDLPLCQGCLDQMELFSGPTCTQCGAPVPNIGAVDDCYRCRGPKIWFDETIALGPYSGKLRELLLRMKPADGDALSLTMAKLIWQKRGERLAKIGADVVAPIPLHWRRRIAHRTNSAAVLAEVLSARLGLPLAEGLLRRTRYTVRQFDVNPSERWKNVRKAFCVRAAYHLREAHVLLVDDILTTGATCSEAARALRDAGAWRVTVVVVARAIG